MKYIIRNKKTKKVIIRADSAFNAYVWYRKILGKENYEIIVVKGE